MNQTYSNYKVIVVDNGSNDGSIEFMKENFNGIKVIELDRNYGFAKANNIGIKNSLEYPNVKYIACLNKYSIEYDERYVWD